jgi:hypothetical protein
MYIEDLIETLTLEYIPVNSWDQKIVHSFYEQITRNTGFTEKQSALALRIVTRYAAGISSKTKVDITRFIENPQYRLPIRKILAEKTIRINNNLIEVRLPYDDNFVTDIRKHRLSNSSSMINWDKDKTAWTLDISESNIMYLLSSCNVGFEYDDAFQNYATQIEEIVANMDKYAPMLARDGAGYTIRNAPATMPAITATEPIEAIFQARRLGVVLWDAEIEEYLNSDKVVKEVCDFLKTPISKSVDFANDEAYVTCLQHILTNLGPSLFVVPGGDELAKTQQAYSILKGIGVEDKNMSVLFRLPTESGRNFNDFVKNQGLNEPITADTKVVFVSGKLPKTVIKSGIKFNSVVNLGYDSVHYTLREYAKTHQNLIYFDVKKKQRGFDFAKL